MKKPRPTHWSTISHVHRNRNRAPPCPSSAHVSGLASVAAACTSLRPSYHSRHTQEEGEGKSLNNVISGPKRCHRASESEGIMRHKKGGGKGNKTWERAKGSEVCRGKGEKRPQTSGSGDPPTHRHTPDTHRRARKRLPARTTRPRALGRNGCSGYQWKRLEDAPSGG